MRKTAINMVYELAKKDERVFFIGSDLGTGTGDEFKSQYPERFFMEGISEQNLIGMAAGLAMEGKIPYVNTIATFLTRRCFEQVVLDCGLHNTNVRLIANGGGLVYTPLGPTHEAIEDIAIMRAIPNMTVVAPADANEMRRLMEKTLDYQGPIYIRMAKGYDPIVTPDDQDFEIGKTYLLKQGVDGVVLTTGITLKLGLDAAQELQKQGLDIGVLHVPTIKPLDKESIIKIAQSVPVIVTVEEHTIIGGLGSAVAEIIAEANFSEPKKFKRIGIPDEFPEKYGSQNSLMREFGINAENIIRSIRDLSNMDMRAAVKAARTGIK